MIRSILGMSVMFNALIVVAQETPPAPPSVEPAVLQAVEDKYASEVSKAEAVLAKVKRDAAVVRLKAYKDRLAEVTKTGDFDKALTFKARVDELEADPDTASIKHGKRPRPKDTVKFGGNTYALIQEPATWHVAKLRCEEMGGHLATGETSMKLAFVTDLCRKSGQHAWVGCSRELDDTWRWLGGEQAKFPPALLDNVGGIEFHLHWNTDTSRWNDAPAGWKFSYVCEWDR